MSHVDDNANQVAIAVSDHIRSLRPGIQFHIDSSGAISFRVFNSPNVYNWVPEEGQACVRVEQDALCIGRPGFLPGTHTTLQLIIKIISTASYVITGDRLTLITGDAIILIDPT